MSSESGFDLESLVNLEQTSVRLQYTLELSSLDSVPHTGSSTLAMQTAMHTGAHMDSSRAAHSGAKRDTSCGRRSGSTKALRRCGRPSAGGTEARRTQQRGTYAHRRFTCFFANRVLRKSRTESHIRHLLDLVAQFPRVNPSADASAPDGDDSQVDVAALLSKIRARYKALCATLGVRPRLRAAGAGMAAQEDTRDGPDASAGKKVWKLDGRQPQAGSNEMSF
jgi:hypothetical protein